MDLCRQQKIIRDGYLKAFQRLKKKQNQDEVKFLIAFLHQDIIKFKGTLKNVSVASRVLTQKTINILKCLLVKFEKLQQLSTVASSKIVQENLPRHSNKRLVEWKDCDNAFQNRMATGEIVNLEHKNIDNFLSDAKQMLIDRIKNILRNKNALKVNTVLALNYKIQKQQTKSAEVVRKIFSKGSLEVLQSSDLNELFADNFEHLSDEVDEAKFEGSGWTLLEILHLEVQVNDYIPLKGGNSSFIEMPLWIQRTRSVINVKNSDQRCFMWSVLAASCKVKNHAELVSSYRKHIDKLNCSAITSLITWAQIKIFERQNNFRIIIYGIETNDEDGESDDENNNKKKSKRKLRKERIVPFYMSKNEAASETFHLLMIERDIADESAVEENGDDDGDDESYNNLSQYHFAWIKNLSRLVYGQISKNKNKKYICDRCLCYFHSGTSRENHDKQCKEKGGIRMKLPSKKDSILKFKSYKYQLKVPFIIYGDLECLLEKVKSEKDGKNQIYQKHIPYSAAYYLKCSYDNSLSNFDLRRGENSIEWFISELEKIAHKVNAILKDKKPMSLTPNEQLDFDNASKCHICDKELTTDDRVRDHCHFTSNYRGAAHKSCNINYQESCIIPVVFHNLTGYDAHFIIKKLKNQFDGEISVLGINKERYISFTKRVKGTVIQFRFIDSYRFMASKIDTLSKNLNNNKKTITKSLCENIDEHELIFKKGVFPYDYLDNWEKLNDTNLPSRDDFYSQLKEEHISDEEYEHAQNVWQKLRIKTLGEYSDFYLQTDVSLLADVFETFRADCLQTYKLDPAHYYTSPGLSFSAMLRYTQVELELLTDAEMMHFIEQGIRGGLSQVSNRYGKANNRYMGDEYNPEEEESFLMYFDLNNMYGAAMRECLPLGEFQWVDNFDISNLNSIADDSESGYILEVDLDYPTSLHRHHKDFPLAPVREKPPLETSKMPKLLATLNNKKNYVVHYRNLKQYCSLGMVVTKVHRALKFKQSAWLKSYIDLNTELRKQACSEFEKDLRKLFINAIYGKTLESVRTRKSIKIVNKYSGKGGARYWISKPNFHSHLIIDDLVIIEMKQTCITFDKPIYLGFSILDISKTYIYDFHYNFIKHKYVDKVKYLYGDTDSAIYHIFTYNPYDLIRENPDKFDTSDYPENNPYRIPLKNKKVIGIMKDENKGKIMKEFIGLRSKLYSYVIEVEKNSKDKPIHKKAKGVKKSTVRQIEFKDYKNCLFEHKDLKKEQNIIRSYKHEVTTMKTEKKALCWEDDKRQLIDGETDTLPWGYKPVE